MYFNREAADASVAISATGTLQELSRRMFVFTSASSNSLNDG
jgi:hypothetical protein